MVRTGMADDQATLLLALFSFHGHHHLIFYAGFKVEAPKSDTMVGLIAVQKSLVYFIAIFAVLNQKMGVMTLCQDLQET